MKGICIILSVTLNVHLLNLQHYLQEAVVAEWLRRLTRNQMGYARAGSNPANCENIFILIKPKKIKLFINLA